MFKTKKKKQEENMRDIELQKTLDEHLELICKNQKMIDGLLDDISDISELIIEHKIAIQNLRDTIEETQELIK